MTDRIKEYFNRLSRTEKTLMKICAVIFAGYFAYEIGVVIGTVLR